MTYHCSSNTTVAEKDTYHLFNHRLTNELLAVRVTTLIYRTMLYIDPVYSINTNVSLDYIIDDKPKLFRLLYT